MRKILRKLLPITFTLAVATAVTFSTPVFVERAYACSVCRLPRSISVKTSLLNDISPFFSINKGPACPFYGWAGSFAFLLTEREESGMILVSPKERQPAWKMRSRRSPWQTDMTNSREPYRQKGSL